jgi:GNAT superfamily N-acetyltransferase
VTRTQLDEVGSAGEADSSTPADSARHAGGVSEAGSASQTIERADPAAVRSGDAVQYRGDAVQYSGDAVLHPGGAVQYRGDAVQYSGDAVLHPGGAVQHRGDAVQYRSATAADCEAIGWFVAGLSLRSRFLRFFTPASPLSSAVLRAMCGTGRTTDVLVATHDGVIIGHAMAVDSIIPDGSRVTDIGMVIADHWQSRGIGSMILGRLVARAAARGVSALVMDVLPENRQMLAMISRRWADAHYKFAADSVTVRVCLSDAPAARGTGRAAA